MKVKPILFQGNMVRANNEGRKTQTRRVLKPQPSEVDRLGRWYKMPNGGSSLNCHNLKYAVGDVVWVREAWCAIGDKGGLLRDLDLSWHAGPKDVHFRADNNEVEHGMCKFRPSIFMPRWASRTTLKITDVRVERLLDISEQDAMSEGISEHFGNIDLDSRGYELSDYRYFYDGCDDDGHEYATDAYFALWDSINAKPKAKYIKDENGKKVVSHYVSYPSSADLIYDIYGNGINGVPLHIYANPWVVAYTYEVIQQNVDDYLKAVA